LLLLKQNRNNVGHIAPQSFLPGLKDSFKMLATFSLVGFAWIFFRADNMSEAFNYITGIFTHPFYKPQDFGESMYYLPVIVILFFIVEWICRNHDIEYFFSKFQVSYVRHAVYLGMLISIIVFGTFKEKAFIYFQF